MSGARSERARGRQERAGARQAGRQERRSAGHAAGVDNRSKDRDQGRAQRQQAWEDRRARRQERDAARKAKREAASAGPGRTTLGKALAEEARRRFDKRRAETKPAADGKDTKPPADATTGAAKDSTAGTPGKDSKAGDGTSGGAKKRRSSRRRRTSTGKAGRRGRTRRTGRTSRAGRGRKGRARGRGRPAGSPFGEEDFTPTVEWPDHPARPAGGDAAVEDDIVDADIVTDPPAAVTTGVRGLPPAPEKHTARPGTTRPTSTEGSSVSSAQVKRTSGQGGLAAKHQTDITFDEYLMQMARIAVQAASDQERAEVLRRALGKVADALREMSTDLVGDHNISTQVTELIAFLADHTARMKQQADRCAQECENANEAAKAAASQVARVYGEDMDAKEEAGLRYTSAATHHD